MTCTMVRFVVSADKKCDREGRAVPPAADEATIGGDPADSCALSAGSQSDDPRSRLSTVGSGNPYEAVDERQPHADPSDDADSDDIARNALVQAQRFTRSSRRTRGNGRAAARKRAG